MASVLKLTASLGILVCIISAVCLAEEEGATTTEASEQNNGGEGESGDTNTASDSEYISCFTCGDPTIDPTQESMSYCDKTKDDNCESDSKMYNHTCDIMDNLGASDAWKRRCPYGVKSCYWAQGKYEKQEPIFRGCAGAHYAHEEKCTRELQAVTVAVGRASVDVEVFLCYCNDDTCNLDQSHAGTLDRINLGIMLVMGLAVILAGRGM